MRQTTAIGLTQAINDDSQTSCHDCHELIAEYEQLISKKWFAWSANLRLEKTLGTGGQGTVYLAKRTGSDDFCIPLAVKVFSPEHYRTLHDYDSDMARVGKVSAQVARIQHENLLSVDHFLDRNRIRIMIMEWIEGFDLRRMVTTRFYGVTKERVSEKRWKFINQHLVTAGPVQPRLRLEAVVTIVRDCLKGLSMLHGEGIVHGDIKPANIMIKRTGNSKIIDIGSATNSEFGATNRACTPVYAAPTVLAGEPPCETSDLVSLGYLAIELLTGQPLFESELDLEKLIEQKRAFSLKTADLLPLDIGEPANMVKAIGSMLAADERLETAESCLQRLNECFPLVDSSANFGIWLDELLEIEDRLAELPGDADTHT